MTLDPKEAAASLDDIAAIERRTRESLYYAGSSEFFLLWGVLTIVGHVASWIWPHEAAWIWLAIDILGFLASVAIFARRWPRSLWRGVGFRWLASYLAFLVYGALTMAVLSPLTGRQQQAFWPMLVMFSYVLAGIWVGRFFLYIGLAAMASILIGFYAAGPWFMLWLAVSLGGGLIAGGLWLRRAA
jgi:hypothetical protein